MLNIPNLHAELIAELWYGTHGRGPSPILLEPRDQATHSLLASGQHNLKRLVEAEGAGVLGDECFSRYGAQLPFLFKVLAAEKGLSIQAHPNKAQAEAGFERENEQGIDIHAFNRNYRDDNHKPECLLALEDFWALSGFLQPAAILANLRQVKQAAVPLLGQLVEILKTGMAAVAATTVDAGATAMAATIKQFYSSLMMADRRAQCALLRAVLEYIRSLDASSDHSEDGAEPQWYWVEELNRQFPDDPGCLAPLYLNLCRLRPGQALFMEAGILHAYLRGTGLEVMANSDNVLRGGCTQKYIDLPQLLSVLLFHAEKPILLNKSSRGWYESFAPEFQLAWMNMVAGQVLELRQDGGLGQRMGIMLITEGSLLLQEDGREVALQQGESVFITAASQGIILAVASSGVSFALASVNK